MKYLLFFIIAALILPKEVSAQTFSVGIDPPLIRIQADPPANAKAEIKLQNLNENSATFQVLIKAFKGSANGGEVDYLPENPSFLSKIIVLENDKEVKEVSLSPRQTKTLTLSIPVSKDEQPRDYYFSVIFLSGDKEAANLNRSQAAPGIATNVLLSIGKISDTTGKISTFSVPSFLSKGPVEFNLIIQNNSSHYITTDGQILIKNMFGQDIGKVDLTPTNILANESREIPAVWKEGFLLGLYSAKINIALSDQGPLLTQDVRFIAFPMELALGILLGLGLILFIVRGVRKRSS
jgi:hypothetical protein